MTFKRMFLFFLCAQVLSGGGKALSKPNAVLNPPAKTTIQNILITTPHLKLKQKITKHLSYFKGQAWGPETRRQINQKLKSFLKKKSILTPGLKGPFVKLLATGVVVSYHIPQPDQYEFILKGSRTAADFELLNKKARAGLFGQKHIAKKAARIIKNIYLKKGYSQAEVTHKVVKHRFIKTVYLNIKEGGLLKIKTIKIFGRFSRPKSYYIHLIKQYSSPLIRQNLFYKEDFDRGLSSLENILHNEGWLQPVIYSKIIPQGRAVTVEVTINEGPRTLIKSIVFKGRAYFSEQHLKNLMKTKTNLGLNAEQLEQDMRLILSAYKNAGFIEVAFTNPKNIVHYDEKTNGFYLKFDISEGPKVVVSDIFIQGLKKTKEQFIRKLLGLKVGDILTAPKTARALKRLRKTGFFSSVDILTARPDNKASPKRAVIVKLKESRPGSIRLALGLNTERGGTAHGSIRLFNKNISGRGRQVFSNIKVQSNIARTLDWQSQIPEHIEHHASLLYTEPFLFNSSFNGQVSLLNADTISLYNLKKHMVQIVNTTKVSFLLQRELTNSAELQWTLLGWEARKEFEQSPRCPGGRVFASPAAQPNRCAGLALNIAGTGLSFNVDKRNSVIAASNGFLSKLVIEYSGPFYIINSSDEINFVKMEWRHFDFQPLFSKWVWMNSIQGGVIASLHEAGGFPVSRAFILGGANSLRGFNGLLDGERVPGRQELTIAGANQMIMSDSSAFFLLKTELRFPINKQINGSVFYDGGAVAVSGREFKQPYRHSAGFGVRYKTPLGPIAGYIAFKISPQKNESLFLPHLSFGSF